MNEPLLPNGDVGETPKAILPKPKRRNHKLNQIMVANSQSYINAKITRGWTAERANKRLLEANPDGF